MLEYTNESMSIHKLQLISPSEFRLFLGTMLLSSSFNASIDTMWEMMRTLSKDKCMTRERYNQILNNLRGFDMSRRMILHYTGSWDDQRNKLKNLHLLEKKIFERTIEFFFDLRSSCLVLDDELISSKGEDIESKLLSDRKAGKEGPATDVISDSFFQILFGMRLRTIGESQLVKVENLLGTMPAIGADYRSSMNGPIIAFDRGYGKVSFISLLVRRNYKVITIANSVGSEHPFVGQSVIDALRKKVVTSHPQIGLDAFENMLHVNNVNDFIIQDIDNILLGPEVRVARSVDDNLFHAVAIRDIFDKKVQQKILCFFIYGFPNIDFFLKYWIIVPKKNDKLILNRLFYEGERAPETVQLEEILLEHCSPLTHAQRTAEWFTLRQFHVSATMASKLVNANDNETVAPAATLQMLSESWFSRARSTPDMVAGTKNETAILDAFLQHPNVRNLFECGLLESKKIPWLAASPDAIAVISIPGDEQLKVAVVEIKTKVSHQRIAAAESIYATYNSIWIEATVGDEIWHECIEPEHQSQLLVQLAVTDASYCCYIVGKAGFEGSPGRILYIIGASATDEVIDTFVTTLTHRCDALLNSFYNAENVDTVVQSLPEGLGQETTEIIRTRWPFFNLMRTYVLTKYDPPIGFPATSLFKTPFQSIYNAFKGGLDSNTQQYCTIKPMMKTCFETKYVIRLILAIVTNSWRAKQFLTHSTDSATGMETYRKQLSNHGPNLRDFAYKLALGLIESSSDPYFQNVLFSQTNNENNTEQQDDIVRDPTTLQSRLDQITWPTRFKLNKFSTDATFIELRLTSNAEFDHQCVMLKTDGKRRKAHCALCLDAQTRYGCTACNVMLCRLPRNQQSGGANCFTIWHTKKDLVAEQQRILAENPNKRRQLRNERKLSRCGRKSRRDSTATSGSKEDDDTASDATNGTIPGVAQGMNSNTLQVDEDEIDNDNDNSSNQDSEGSTVTESSTTTEDEYTSEDDEDELG